MNFAPATVLVIENHPIMRDALCVAITEASDLKAIMQAGSVADALPLLEQAIPDIVLLALQRAAHGDMDSLTLLRKSLPKTPILALTSNEIVGQEEAALKYGAQIVLTKAAPRAELIQALRQLCPTAFC